MEIKTRYELTESFRCWDESSKRLVKWTVEGTVKSLGLVFRNAMTCVSGRRYDSILQSVWLPIKQGGTTESNFRPW